MCAPHPTQRPRTLVARCHGRCAHVFLLREMVIFRSYFAPRASGFVGEGGRGSGARDSRLIASNRRDRWVVCAQRASRESRGRIPTTRARRTGPDPVSRGRAQRAGPGPSAHRSSLLRSARGVDITVDAYGNPHYRRLPGTDRIRLRASASFHGPRGHFFADEKSRDRAVSLARSTRMSILTHTRVFKVRKTTPMSSHEVGFSPIIGIC